MDVAFSGDGMDMDMDDGIGLMITQRLIPDSLVGYIWLISWVASDHYLGW